MEDVKKYVKIAERKSYEKLQKENEELQKTYWKGRWDSYFDLLSMMAGREQNRIKLRLDKKEGN